MKNITYVALLGTMFFSCKKTNSLGENHTSMPTSLNSTPPLSYDYEAKYDSILKAATYGLIDILPNYNYRQIINTEVAKQFDDDDNALFREIKSAFNTNSLNLQTLMENSCSAHGYSGYSYLIPEVLNGFKYFTDTVYPQLYIPFYENYNINTVHSVCYNLEDDAILPGFTFVGGSLSNLNITETFAQEHPTYVTSVNEVVNNSGLMPTNNLTVKNRGNSKLALSVKQFKISSKKEKWGNGKSEVENVFRLYKPSNCSNIFANYGFTKKVKSSNLNNWVYPNDRTEIFWDPYWWETTDAAFIVLYEKDRRNKFNKTIAVPNCSGLDLNYTSKEDIYGTHVPSRTDYAIPTTGAQIDVNIGNNNFITLHSTWWEQ